MGLVEEKVVVITGAGRGIGAASARLLAQEGALVVVNDAGVSPDGTGRDPSVANELATEINQAGGQALASTHDVSDANEAQALIALAQSHFGQVDVLINNAGFLRDKTFFKLDVADLDALLSVHLRGAFLCTQAAAKLMTANGGSIINTTGLAGLQGNFGQAAFAAAQAAVYGLTRTCSIELQRYSIRVNAVAALAKTRLTADLPMFENVNSMRPEHVAPVNLFLASDLSRDVSGSVVSVAGGRISTFRLIESPGKFKESGDGIWTAQEIAEHFGAIGAPGRS